MFEAEFNFAFSLRIMKRKLNSCNVFEWNWKNIKIFFQFSQFLQIMGTEEKQEVEGRNDKKLFQFEFANN